MQGFQGIRINAASVELIKTRLWDREISAYYKNHAGLVAEICFDKLFWISTRQSEFNRGQQATWRARRWNATVDCGAELVLAHAQHRQKLLPFRERRKQNSHFTFAQSVAQQDEIYFICDRSVQGSAATAFFAYDVTGGFQQ